MRYKFMLKELKEIEIEDIHYSDYPDFSDAFLSHATYRGRTLSDDELSEIQGQNPDWFYEQIEKIIY